MLIRERTGLDQSHFQYLRVLATFPVMQSDDAVALGFVYGACIESESYGRYNAYEGRYSIPWPNLFNTRPVQYRLAGGSVQKAGPNHCLYQKPEIQNYSAGLHTLV